MAECYERPVWRSTATSRGVVVEIVDAFERTVVSAELSACDAEVVGEMLLSQAAASRELSERD